MSDDIPNKQGLTKGRVPRLPLALANLNGLGAPLTVSKWGTSFTPPSVTLGSLTFSVSGTSLMVQGTPAAVGQSFVSLLSETPNPFAIGKVASTAASSLTTTTAASNSINVVYLYPAAPGTRIEYKVIIVYPSSTAQDPPIFLSLTATGSF